ncbi:MAG: ParA family protein [Gammaproteobacteria bacterium]|jgi:chromosome partitioning protein|nr:ParA family protein [Gammaproteobacteria bacterium]MDP7270677.1 ParA family protein [Gammaproteobacteria bacterium]HJP05542.1 ParA family protein [Gammaproteobacteria bacterium]
MRLSVPGHKDLHKIVVLNPKGGCGKSTLAVNLAGYLASQGNSVAIMDFDPQGSSMRWLKLRPGNSAPIHGISAFDVRSSVTRSWQLRVPPSVRCLVVDSPALAPPENLAELTSGAHAILIPVLPSEIDVYAASQLMKDLLLIAKVSRRMGRIGVIANRVRENTLAYRKLMRFLNSLSISVIGVLRDSQNYVHSAEQGLSIHEMRTARTKQDAERWEPIFAWLEEKLETPLTPRDFRRPRVQTQVHQFNMQLPQD